MNTCTKLHDKLIYEENLLEEIPHDERADYILNITGRNLCGYCLEQCPDRFDCEKYKKSAK